MPTCEPLTVEAMHNLLGCWETSHMTLWPEVSGLTWLSNTFLNLRLKVVEGDAPRRGGNCKDQFVWGCNHMIDHVMWSRDGMKIHVVELFDPLGIEYCTFWFHSVVEKARHLFITIIWRFESAPTIKCYVLQLLQINTFEQPSLPKSYVSAHKSI
jgi:hypothetical protein